MKHTSILFLLFSFGFCYAQTNSKPENPLFQIIENGKTGFINSTGQVIIQPAFRSAGDFSEGLAHARINGTYGYIDRTGNFLIQPQFDYAMPFSEGLALVYKAGVPFFINKKGEKEFESNFDDMGSFKNGRAVVRAKSGKQGYINKQGKLFIDTVYEVIKPFVSGLAVVWNPKQSQAGVIDTLGNFVIPFGKYAGISDYADGYFKAEIHADPSDSIKGYQYYSTIIDRTGKTVISVADKNYCRIAENVHCGLAQVYLSKRTKNKESYQGYINMKSEISINDTNYIYVNDFSGNRAFVQDKDQRYSMINTEGKIISQEKYHAVHDKGFRNGVTFVKDANWKWGMIDTNANYIIKPQFRFINDAGLIDDYFFFSEENTNEESDYEDLSGVALRDGTILIGPIMEEYDSKGFKDGLLKCVVGGRMMYFDKTGKKVWHAAEDKSKQIENLNIDFMNRGYFQAYSKPSKKDLGGFGGSGNIPKKNAGSDNFTPGVLSVIVRPEMKATVYGLYNGMKVFVANASGKEISFNAQDSRLYMKVQALNAKGEWKDIEYLPSSWCGNSYHTLTLEPKHHWNFIMPVYEGDLKTKLRVELKYLDPDHKPKDEDEEQKEITVYSNEFEGSVNEGQFWRIRKYYPQGLMDPYND
jgi:hypothetical protein